VQGTRVHGHHNKKKRRLVPPLQAPKPYGAGEGVALLKWRFRGLAFRLQPELEAKAGEGGLPREKGRWRERGGGGGGEKPQIINPGLSCQHALLARLPAILPVYQADGRT